MGQDNCGRMAAGFMVSVLALSPAFAMDREAGGPHTGEAANTALVSATDLAAQPCPTRFDYLVLASFADAPSLLSFSSYHFRSEAGFSSIPLTGLLRVGYRVDPGGDCRSRSLSPRRESG
jgi:hypothetical protein